MATSRSKTASPKMASTDLVASLAMRARAVDGGGPRNIDDSGAFFLDPGLAQRLPQGEAVAEATNVLAKHRRHERELDPYTASHACRRVSVGRVDKGAAPAES